ncbi:MAG: hypothetical protein ACPLPS_04720, partial [bacterium]
EGKPKQSRILVLKERLLRRFAVATLLAMTENFRTPRRTASATPLREGNYHNSPSLKGCRAKRGGVVMRIPRQAIACHPSMRGESEKQFASPK